MYVEPSQRWRLAAFVALVAVLVGLLAGYAVGKNSAKTAGDIAAAARSKGADAATALSRLPIEYEQAARNASGESQNTVIEAIDAASSLLAAAYRSAPWLGPGLRKATSDAIAMLRRDVRAAAAPAQLQQDVDAAAGAIANQFDVDSDEAVH
jgi:hypothetical protein